ncbi:hypothetical protein HR12_41645 [Microbacterium sp. SUBG005]|nr:hypothetical protein HR12_41645 [Microbacterium sp. SUBG005]
MTVAALLPTVDGFVHGLVQVEPVFVVQCDGCGRVAVGETTRDGRRTTLVIMFCGIIFGHAAGDERRMCARCRLEAGGRTMTPASAAAIAAPSTFTSAT